MNSWELPVTMEVGGKTYKINTDYRDILEIIRYLDDPDTPEILRWNIAVSLFYDCDIPRENLQEAMEKMAEFIGENEESDDKPHPKLIDWEQDALPIVADINKVAGCEIRSLPYLHWWTFLAYFRGIGEGQLSTIVSIRDKKARHKKPEKWEQEYYQEHKKQIDLKPKESYEERMERERLLRILDGK